MKKKTIFLAFAILGLSALMSSCGSGVGGSVDPKILENKEEVQKIYDVIMQAMGAQAAKADEIRISIDNPADKGRTGDSYLTLMMDMQDPNKPKQLLRQLFHGELNRWLPTEEVTVQVWGNDKENFRLENELFDFTKISAEQLFNMIQTAFNKENAEAGKYIYRYVNSVVIDAKGINVTVKGKLESNDQVISKSVKFDLAGNEID